MALTLTGCETLNSSSAPKELKDNVAKNAAVAQEITIRNQANPLSPEHMDMYLQQNSEAWNELDNYYNRNN